MSCREVVMRIVVAASLLAALCLMFMPYGSAAFAYVIPCEGTCCGERLSLNPDYVCPGVMASAEAHLNYEPNVGENPNVWSLEDNEEGSYIDSYACDRATKTYWCDVVAGEKTGNGEVIIVATNPADPNCQHRVTLGINGVDDRGEGGGGGGGGCCGSGASQPGQANVGLNSVHVTWPLGQLANGRSAGAIVLESTTGGSELGTPELLEYKSYSNVLDDNVVVYYNNDDMLEQVCTEGVAAVVDYDSNSPGHYEIQFFITSTGDYITTASPPFIGWDDPNYPDCVPFTVWSVDSPDGNTLVVTKEIDAGAGLVAQARYEYHLLTNTLVERTWQLTRQEGDETDPNNALTRETLSWVVDDPNDADPNLPPLTGLWVRTYTREDAVDATFELVQKSEELWVDGLRVERSVYTDDLDNALITTYSYYTSGAHAGEVGLVVGPYGKWMAYAYDPNIQDPNIHDTIVIEGLGDTAAPASLNNVPAYNSAGVRATIKVRTTVPGAASGRLTSVDEYADGHQISATTYEYDDTTESGAGVLRVTETRVGDPNDLQTKRRLDLNNDDRLLSVVYPDGRMTMVEYDPNGSFDANTPSFDPLTPGTFARIATRYGLTVNGWSTIVYPDGEVSADTVVRDARGNVVMQEQYATNVSTARIDWSTSVYDVLGRETATYHADGTHRTTAWSVTACCGTRTVTDEQGSQRSYVYDVLGRLTQVTLQGVTGAPSPLDEDVDTYYGYQVASNGTTGATEREVLAVVDGTGVNPETSTARYDWTGRLVSTTSQANLTTGYVYGTTGSGGKQVTITHPGGATEVNAYYCDGRIKSKSGTAVVAEAYAYSVDQYGSQTTCTRIGTSDPTDSTWPRWRTTTYDRLGRVISEARPAFDSATPVTTTNVYDSVGRLVSTSVTDGDAYDDEADTLYVYDPVAPVTVIRSGRDMNDNGVLDANDPVTETRAKYVQINGEWWHETKTWVYDDGEAVPSAGYAPTTDPEQIVRRRLSGFSNNVVSEVETTDAAGHVATELATLNAGTATLTTTTDLPNTTNDATRVATRGQLVSETTATGVTYSYGYDGLGRRISVADSRTNNPTFTHYTNGRVDSVYTTANQQSDGTKVTDATYGYTSAGRVSYVGALTTGATYKYTRYKYTDRGDVAVIWGNVPQPVLYEYDPNFGERTTMTTWRSSAVWMTFPAQPSPMAASGDTTTWEYDAATGLLTRKEYADTQGTDYDYYADGKLKQREWARGVTADYTYTLAGQLHVTDYSDSTPDPNYAYDRRGRLAHVAAGTLSHTFDYSEWPVRVRETVSGGPYSSPLVITQDMTTYNGRLGTLGVGPDAQNQFATYRTDYSYDSATGRLQQVSGPGLFTPATYTYASNSDLVQRTAIGSVMRQSRTFESGRDVVDTVTNEWYPGDGEFAATLSSYDYANDTLGRRTDVKFRGVAFSWSNDPNTQTFQYNDRNELTYSARDDGADLHWQYQYDPIGNRVQFWDQDDPNLAYHTNELNQYVREERTTFTDGVHVLYEYDADGNLTSVRPPGDANCDGIVNMDDLDAMIAAADGEMEWLVWFAQHPLYSQTCPYSTNDVNGDGYVDYQDRADLYYMVVGGVPAAWSYTWDAENRLISAAPGYDEDDRPDGAQRLLFDYDYMGRRVQKVVQVWDDPNSVWVETLRRKFVWSGWKLLMELNANDTPIRKYTWGLDLAGQNGQVNSLEGAGTIGGLLAAWVQTAPGPGWHSQYLAYTYDANGNVSEVVDLQYVPDVPDQAIVAHYEYTPFGRLLESTGGYATENPFRFSTKYWDDETGLGYWGYRYYSPTLGRWISSDPSGYVGGAHLYAYVFNQSPGLVDSLGLWKCGACGPGDTCCSQWVPMWQILGKPSAGACTADLFLASLPSPAAGILQGFLQSIAGSSLVELTGASGVISMITSAATAAGMASGDLIALLYLAADTCTDQYCMRERQADSLLTCWCWSGRYCTCIGDDGSDEDFAGQGDVRDDGY